MPAETVVVNGVFQGGLVPQEAQRVRLEFKPYARYALVGHVAWLVFKARRAFDVLRKGRCGGKQKVSIT